MSVIIRLQNLPWSANAADIRQFFHGLSIPEGGVHIVGGQLGDAFIAFRYIAQDPKSSIENYREKNPINLVLWILTEFGRTLKDDK